jgi:hypothetical protein
METSEFEVTGEPEVLNSMLKNMPKITISERWSNRNWNVLVPLDNDDFEDWCEDNNIQYKMV